MDDFFKSAGDLGLKYIDVNYVSGDQNATAKEEQAQKYEQIQQKTSSTPVKSPLDNKLYVYGAAGAVLLLTAVIVLKGK